MAADLIAGCGEGDSNEPNDDRDSLCSNDTGALDDRPGRCDGSLSSSDDEVEAEEAPCRAARDNHQAIRDHAHRLLSMSSMRCHSMSKNDEDETNKGAGITEHATGRSRDASRANAEASVASVVASPAAAEPQDDEGPGERSKFEVKSVPQWRFAATAKKSEGYSSKSAGERAPVSSVLSWVFCVMRQTDSTCVA